MTEPLKWCLWQPLFLPETSYLRDHMWYLASCLHLLCRAMQKRWRILPPSVSAVPLVHKGIGERSVSLPRKMQCNGGIEARLTTSRLWYAVCSWVCHEVAHSSVSSQHSCRGWLGRTGCVWHEQGIGAVPGVVLVFCLGMWGTVCLKQRWSLAFC